MCSRGLNFSSTTVGKIAAAGNSRNPVRDRLLILNGGGGCEC
jgi:hypothetical protein